MNSKNMYRIKNNPWISIGGSYPGALSAWYRYKYPHLTVGAIASSAVINAFAYYPQFDEQMYLSANKSGDYCWKAINDTSARVEDILKTKDAAAFKAQFSGADKLSDVEFLFFWSDAIVEKIQYGSRTQLCDNVKGKSADDLLKYFIAIVKENSVTEYGSYYLKNDTYYTYPWFNIASTKILQEPGLSNAAPSSDGGKQFQMSILWDPNKSISTSTDSSAPNLLE